MTAIVRAAYLSDLDILARFQQNMASETEGITLDPQVLQAGLAQLFHDPTKGKYYVAEINGTLAGCLMTTYEWSDWRNGTVIWIQSVYIDRPYRGKGVYRALYDHIQKRVLSDPELRGIRLYVDKTNEGAQKVYEALGMNGEHYQMYEWMKG